MQLIKAANSISEKAISNSNKPVKIVYLRKLTNQSLLRGAHVIEMATASKFVFMKARKSTKRETCQLKRKITMVEIYIYIYFSSFSWWILVNTKADQTCQRTTRLFMANLLLNVLHEKLNIC